MSFSGGCQCGAVRYTAARMPTEPHLCHCRMCQKAAGNYFMPLGGVAHDDFEITRGAVSYFHSSDVVRRGFCASCGTPYAGDCDQFHRRVRTTVRLSKTRFGSAYPTRGEHDRAC